MLKSEKPGFLFRVNTLVKSLFSETNEKNDPVPSKDPLADHNDKIIDSLENSYYLSDDFNKTDDQAMTKKLPIGLSMNEQKQKIVIDILQAAKVKQENHEIIDLKKIIEVLALEYQGTPYENLLNLMLNNDIHINFNHLMQSNQEFISLLKS